MPEGHTIHRRARDHTRWLEGGPLAVSSPQGRFAEGAAHLDGATLVRAHALGKHLLYQFDCGWVHVHLGLFGRFRRYKPPAPEPRGAIRLRLAGARKVVDLIGPTDCSLWGSAEVQALRDRLGPDPLDPDADPERMWTRIGRSRRTIGGLLMDQAVVAGIGNVYRAELLFRAGLSPFTPGKEVPRETLEQLWHDAVTLLTLGARYDRIITKAPEDVDKPLYRLNRGERVYVYKRKHCPRCEGHVASKTLESRTVYWCPGCQEVPR
jgi:endonuclease-8